MAIQKQRTSNIQKKKVKHLITGVEIVDKLLRDEKKPEKIMLLQELRKEMKRLWQR